MNSLVNDSYIKAQVRLARRTQLYGMLLVVASFIGSLFLIENPLLVFFSYPALIVGFPMWQIGRGRARRWSEEAKVPPLVAAELRGVSTKHTLYSYVLLPGAALIDHLVVGPDGFYVIEMKPGGSQVTCRQDNGRDRWSEKLGFLERLARVGEEGMANPTQALETQIAALKKWLADNKLASADVPVYGVVVFRNPRTTLDVGDSQFEALLLDELKSFVMTPLPEDEQVPGAHLPTDDRNRVNAALRELVGAPAQAAQPPARAGSSARTSAPAKPASPARTSAPAKPASPARTSSPARSSAQGPRSRTTATPKRGGDGSRKGS